LPRPFDVLTSTDNKVRYYGGLLETLYKKSHILLTACFYLTLIEVGLTTLFVNILLACSSRLNVFIQFGLAVKLDDQQPTVSGFYQLVAVQDFCFFELF